MFAEVSWETVGGYEDYLNMIVKDHSELAETQLSYVHL